MHRVLLIRPASHASRLTASRVGAAPALPSTHRVEGAGVDRAEDTNDGEQELVLGRRVALGLVEPEIGGADDGKPLGTASLEKSLTILKPGGLAISVVGPPDPAFAAQLGKSLLKPVMALLSRKVRSRARKLGVRYSFFFMQANGAQLAKLAALYDDGTLRPVLDRTFAFDETLEAMAYVEQGKANGKIVVTR